MEILQRSDIVGKRIAGVYQSPWDVDPDGFGACNTYVELDDGVAFELLCHDTDMVLPIVNVDITKVQVTACNDSYFVRCIGATVLEVLKSDFWPSTGLLLSHDSFLYIRDFPNRNRSGALLIGPYADKVGETYDMKDAALYWGELDLAD